MALSREPTTNPESQRLHSPVFFLVVLAAIVVGLAALMILRNTGETPPAKPLTNGVQQAVPSGTK